MNLKQHLMKITSNQDQVLAMLHDYEGDLNRIGGGDFQKDKEVDVMLAIGACSYVLAEMVRQQVEAELVGGS